MNPTARSRRGVFGRFTCRSWVGWSIGHATVLPRLWCFELWSLAVVFGHKDTIHERFQEKLEKLGMIWHVLCYLKIWLKFFCLSEECFNTSDKDDFCHRVSRIVTLQLTCQFGSIWTSLVYSVCRCLIFTYIYIHFRIYIYICIYVFIYIYIYIYTI